MKIRASQAILAVFAALWLGVALAAQVSPTGTPPFASFGGGPADSINLANLDINLGINLAGRKGRGISFSDGETYDGMVWQPVVSGSTTYWTFTGGWTERSLLSGAVHYTTSVFTCYPGDGTHYNYKVFANFTFTDGQGTVHAFTGMTIDNDAQDICGGIYSNSWQADDGTDLTLVSQVQPGFSTVSSSVISTDGTQLLGFTNTYGGATSVEDRNGNTITLSGATVTDTLGTTAETAATSGCPSNCEETLTYAGPQGNVAAVVKYGNYTIRTNFGCTNITEGSGGPPLVSEIDLPDGSKYQFTYEATPGYSGDVTGRIASITLPTGGEITYAYSGGSNGITCADGGGAILTRTTPDGAWTYSRVKPSGQSYYQTTVQDPAGNQTVVYTQSLMETERDIYQGTVTGGTLKRTIFTCYNGATWPCNSTAVALPVTEVATVTRLETGQENEQDQKLLAAGVPTEVDDYDYGASAPGALLRKTLTTYTGFDLMENLPTSVVAEDGSGTKQSETDYAYDQTAATISGATELVNVGSARGNPTTVTTTTQGSATLKRTLTYFDTGMVATDTEANGAETTFTYGACNQAFPTAVQEPLSLSKSMAWNCGGAVMNSATDENGNTTTTTWGDANFWRPTAIEDAAGDTTNYTYTGTTAVEKVLSIASGSAVDTLTTLDSQGRVHFVQSRQSPGSGTFDTVETDYDSDGRPYQQSVPYAAAAGAAAPSGTAFNITQFDALGRPLEIEYANNGSNAYGYLQLGYNGNDTLQTLGPAPSGESTKKRQMEYDGLGRLSSVCEVTGMPGSGTCGQTTSATGFWTTYTRNPLGEITGVTQNAQASSGQQTRSFSFDEMGRMTSETNPESGTTSYVYDADSACGSSAGDLVKRTDAISNVTCYRRDALHRLLSTTYSGSYAAVTASRSFLYDAATVGATAMQNAKGRLAEAFTQVGGVTQTDLLFSYTALGQVAQSWEKTPDSGGYYNLSATYFSNGGLEQLSGLPGSFPTVNYSLDGEGRPAGASAGGNTLASGVSYNPFGEASGVTFGSSDSDSFSYDAATGRMTGYTFNVGSASDTGTLSWNPNGTLGGLVISDALNSANSQSCGYTHDDLGRVASVNCGSVWSQTFNYDDAFGNLNKSATAGTAFSASFNLANQIAEVGTFVPNYDADGNLLDDPMAAQRNAYGWDAEGKPVTLTGGGVTSTQVFDALGRMAEQQQGGTDTEILYAPSGAKLALMSGMTVKTAFVALPGGGTAVYSGTGLAYYRHADWQGSSRLASTPSRTVHADLAYGPYGEPYAASGSGSDSSYTGQNQDTVAGLYDFPMREYSAGQSRWLSPDPGGTSVVDPNNPETWNRYAYVGNQPLANVDPLGMDSTPPCTPGPLVFCAQSAPACDKSNDFCGGNGGPYVFSVTVTASDASNTEWEQMEYEDYMLQQLANTWEGPYEHPFGAFGSITQVTAGPPGKQAGTPWNGSCAAKAAGSFLVHGAADALGAIPGEGAVAAAFAGGTEAFQAVQAGVGLGATAYGASDTSASGRTSTTLGVFGMALSFADKYKASLAKDVAEMVPGAAEFVAGLSVAADAWGAIQQYADCARGH